MDSRTEVFERVREGWSGGVGGKEEKEEFIDNQQVTENREVQRPVG
jgi:hypothetical protein